MIDSADSVSNILYSVVKRSQTHHVKSNKTNGRAINIKFLCVDKPFILSMTCKEAKMIVYKWEIEKKKKILGHTITDLGLNSLLVTLVSVLVLYESLDKPVTFDFLLDSYCITVSS